MRASRRAPLRLALPVALTLLLAGCAAPAPHAPTVSPQPSGLPSGVPLLPGEVVSRGSAGDRDWLVSVRTDDPQRDYRRARRLLLDAGYVLTKDRAGTGGGDGQACTSALCVGFTAGGTTVDYEVFPPTGAP